ncbi:hypothetical protein OH76DRAFT_211906 [Lentinus brumalis]|uniref:F-box domain-containing protein n=1 Tax=Lentinus brumalis TaxID=2498619 RepID=A0A371CMP2_9APHY|nr:hypothetical protein OH76DRAFT_211906 [Polyporus brumalis]
MPTPELPSETTDCIIAHVWPDIPTLLNCALVCSRWLPASRHHLFSEINFPSRSSYDLLVARVLHSEHMRPWLASVRSMEFIELRGIGEGRWLPIPPAEQIGQLFLRDFIGQLPNMHSLRFQGEDWAQCRPRPGAFAAFSQFPSLSKLDLFDCFFPSFAALRQMLSALPALSSLMINGAQWPVSSNPHPVSAVGPNSRPRLETLYFVMEGVNDAAREFMDWLVQTASRSSIHHLEVFNGFDPTTDPWSVISSYTHLFAASVDYLRLVYVESSHLYPTSRASPACLSTSSQAYTDARTGRASRGCCKPCGARCIRSWSRLHMRPSSTLTHRHPDGIFIASSMRMGWRSWTRSWSTSGSKG